MHDTFPAKINDFIVDGFLFLLAASLVFYWGG
jgi:hypothetical protein